MKEPPKRSNKDPNNIWCPRFITRPLPVVVQVINSDSHFSAG